VTTYKQAHLIGIAGSGMRSLARVLLGWGWRLSGSDVAPGAARSLAEAGVHVAGGHAAENLPPGTQLVIHSDAIGEDNPELRRAAELGIPTQSYFETLGRLMRRRRGVAVAGTHGKSTTTAMAADLLVRAGFDPTVVHGAAPLGTVDGGRPGRGELMLVEACEYRANFLHLCPRQAVILGIEPDHFDCYDSLEELERAFGRFAASLPGDGLLLARHECTSTRRATAGARCRVETFGLHSGADWSARLVTSRRGRYRFAIFRHGRPLCDVSLRVPGRYNVLNALAAAAVAWRQGVEPEAIGQGLSGFRGLHRRLEEVGSWRGVTILDDYAHHPTEVAATLDAVRRMVPTRRLWCVFQPHQVSRTARLLDELAASLQNSDRLLVADIFRAREPGPRPGEVTAADLARRAGRLGIEVSDVHTTEEIVRELENRLTPGDVLITLGAGDIRKVGDELTNRLREDRAAG
jgi:UDP-N-acetylmuramate--alanine ligase